MGQREWGQRLHDAGRQRQVCIRARRCRNSQNITLGGHQFAVQPTWSNEAVDAGGDGCVVSR